MNIFKKTECPWQMIFFLPKILGHVHIYEAAFGVGVIILIAVIFLSIALFQKQNQKKSQYKSLK